MAKWTDWLASLAVHGAVACAVAVAWLSRFSAERSEPEPETVYFEVVDEASAEACEEAADDREPEQQEVSEPPPEAPREDQPEAPPEASPEAPPAEPQPTIPPEPPDKPPQERLPPPSEPGEALPAADESPEERASVVSDPIALNRIVPVYPRSARRKGHEGCVVVEVAVADDGKVSGAEVLSPSGHDELDAAALGAVRTACFAPATEDGVGVSGRLRLVFDFRLR